MYLLYIPWHFPLHNDNSAKGTSLKAEKAFEYEYPAIYYHLLKYKNNLINRNKSETCIRYEWYALQRWGADYWEDFSKPKIVWKRIGSILRFSYDENGLMALDSTCFATGNHMKFLIAVLNSKMGKYLMKDSPQTGTGDLLISVQAIEPLKIPLPDLVTETRVNYLVESILQEKHHEQRILEFENEISDIIYNLFQLNEQECLFIESQ